MNNKKLLDIGIEKQSKIEVLEKIKKFLAFPNECLHIVSLNPENLVVAEENAEFKKALKDAQIKIVDGIGVALAAKIKGIEVGERITGVGLMEELIRIADNIRLRVLLIGGKPDLAVRLAQCYQQSYKNGKFLGVLGIKDIQNPKREEEDKIFSIVADYKPHIVLVAFGSPAQELWLWKNRSRFNRIVCMGVGGAFDYLSGDILRAPKVIQRLGLEWLFRLVRQPWRIKRQLRLFRFLISLIKDL